jgi:hypothetical protein
MNEETVVAESSAADDVFGGQQPTLDEYNSYRQSGELPERFKPAEKAESATADAQEETEESEAEEAESAGESETPEESQEQKPKKPQTAKERVAQLDAKIEELWNQDEPDTIKIAQLEATKEKIERRAGIKRKTEVASVTPAQNAEEPVTRAKPTAEDKDKDGNPKYTTYEDFVEDLADWKAEQRQAKWEAQQAQRKAQEALEAKLNESRARYEDADEVIFPAAQQINEAKIPQVVKEVFAGSDLFTDLCYVVGSDPDELNKFLSLANSNPRAAIAKVFEYERGIREELAPKGEKQAPEPKRTSAPKPPSPVSGASSRAFDVSDESLSPEEWMRKRNAQLSRKG